MPQMSCMYTLDISLEKFLAACSDSELIELDFLLEREFRIRKDKSERRSTTKTRRTLRNTKNNIIIKELKA